MSYPRHRILSTKGVATHQSVHDRNFGFVFKHYALFNHKQMTVRYTVAFGLDPKKTPNVKQDTRVD